MKTLAFIKWTVQQLFCKARSPDPGRQDYSGVRKQGGAASTALGAEATATGGWAVANRVSLQAIHIAGSDHSTADALCRKASANHEWSLKDVYLDYTFAWWCTPEVATTLCFTQTLSQKLRGHSVL